MKTVVFRRPRFRKPSACKAPPSRMARGSEPEGGKGAKEKSSENTADRIAKASGAKTGVNLKRANTSFHNQSHVNFLFYPSVGARVLVPFCYCLATVAKRASPPLSSSYADAPPSAVRAAVATAYWGRGVLRAGKPPLAEEPPPR